ncbi:MAG: sigma-70 family RNA polymerase sigma factor [Thermodesulfobacteriota bacterium]
MKSNSSRAGNLIKNVKDIRIDSPSIDTILMEHLDTLYTTAYRLVKNKETAEDLVQDTCLKAVKYFDKLRSKEKSKQWLFKILMNTFINKYRKKIKEPPILELDLSESIQAYASRNSEHTLDPEKLLLERNFNNRIKEALDKLHVDMRSVVLLSDVEGFTYQEMSEILNCPAGTIASRLFRARSFLRESLLKYTDKSGSI